MADKGLDKDLKDDLASTVPSIPARRRRKRPDARIGQLLDGRFEITRLVARGGMGKIYEAIQRPLDRRIALKVMDLGFAEDLDPDFQKRFFLEASTCAKLSHPNTVRVFDYGSTGEERDTYYIAMEFIEGRTLLRVIDESAPLTPLRITHIGRQICASLREAHEMGVIHRDLKPSNVLLTTHGDQSDFVKVLDFGLVKLMQEDAEDMTKTGLFLGSPNYMSPEQIRSDKLDQRSDLYSLGVLLYMGLTATSPFKRESSVKVLLAQLEDAPEPFSAILPPGTVPDSLEWVVMTCLQKDRTRRFLSVAELGRALKACAAEIRGLTGPLEMSLNDGRLVLPTEVSDLLDHNSQPQTVTRGELQAARSRSGRTRSGVAPRMTGEDEPTQEDDALPTEPSMPALHKPSMPPLHKTKSAPWAVPTPKFPLTALVTVILLLPIAVLFVRPAPQLSPPPTTEPSDAPEAPQGTEASSTTTEPGEGVPTAPGVNSPSESPETAEPGPPVRRSVAAEPKERVRRPKRRRRPPPKTVQSPWEGKANNRAIKNRPAGDDRSGVGSVSRDETRDGRQEGGTSKPTSPKKKNGDLRDPWGD